MNSRNLLSAALAAGVLLLAVPVVYFLLVKGSAAGPGGSEEVHELTAELNRTREELQAAVHRITALEKDLEVLGDDLFSGALPVPTAEPASAESGGDTESVDPEEPADSGKARRERELVARFLGGQDPEPLRQFVAEVIDEEQKARLEEQKRQAEERRRQYEELRQGPYGKYNYKVNSMAEKLGMDDSQKQRYYELLTYYREQFQEARKGINRKDRSSWTEYQEQREALQNEFDAGVSRILTADQTAVYRDIPAWQKNAESNSGVMIQSYGGTGQWTGGNITIQTTTQPE